MNKKLKKVNSIHRKKKRISKARIKEQKAKAQAEHKTKAAAEPKVKAVVEPKPEAPITETIQDTPTNSPE